MAHKLIKALRSHRHDNGTSDEERIVDDAGVYGVYGLSQSGSCARPNRPGKKSNEDCSKSLPSIEQCRRWQESIENVLNDPKGEAHFKKFLHKEFATENYEFWNAIKQLKKKNPQGDKLKRDVRQIYEGYISDNAKTPINVNGKLKNAMSEAIEDPNLNIFDDAQKHVYTLMKDGPYKRFILQDNIQDILRGHG